jgi:mono/diheme cytochrome c family protein
MRENTCIGCHRQNAQGQKMFPNLTDTNWTYGSSDAQIRHSIANGRQAAMPAWDNVLTDEQIAQLSDYLLSLDPERLALASPHDIAAGRTLYAKHCVSCHGADAKGKQEIGAPNLADAIWLYGGDKTLIVHSIKNGLNGTMPAFATRLTPPELVAVASYVKHLADEDIEAIWAYLKSVAPRDRKDVENTGLFSVNIRFPLAIWSLLYGGDDDSVAVDKTRSDAWNRDKYLVLGLGHCAECHSPRNFAQAMIADKFLMVTCR